MPDQTEIAVAEKLELSVEPFEINSSSFSANNLTYDPHWNSRNSELPKHFGSGTNSNSGCSGLDQIVVIESSKSGNSPTVVIIFGPNCGDSKQEKVERSTDYAPKDQIYGEKDVIKFTPIVFKDCFGPY